MPLLADMPPLMPAFPAAAAMRYAFA